MSRVMIYPATHEGCPHADMGTCIACFCCQEICPEKLLPSCDAYMESGKS